MVQDEHRSTEVDLLATPTENGVKTTEENINNVATPVQAPEPQSKQVRNEIKQSISRCFVHSVK